MAIGSRNSVADLRPAWLRWVLPSVGDLIFVALVGVLAFTALSVRLLGDGGEAGPRENSFSGVTERRAIALQEAEELAAAQLAQLDAAPAGGEQLAE